MYQNAWCIPINVRSASKYVVPLDFTIKKGFVKRF